MRLIDKIVILARIYISYMETNRTFWILLILSSISMAGAIHWTIALLFYDGLLNINAIGEGWLEAIFFSVAGSLGFHELIKINRSN